MLALNNCFPEPTRARKETAQAKLSLARAAPRELLERRGREAVQFGERNGKRCTLPSQRLKVELVVQLMTSGLSNPKPLPAKRYAYFIA